jgi:hypothetical protein
MGRNRRPYRASKTVGMPWFIQCFEPAVSATNDLLTRATLDAEQFFVVLSTIGFAAVQVEALVGYLFTTMCADEVLGMEHFANSFNTRLSKS